MSLINKVLKELDRNRPQHTKQAEPQQRTPIYQAATSLPLGSPFKKYHKKIFNIYTLLLAIIIALAFTLLSSRWHHSANSPTKPTAVIKVPHPIPAPEKSALKATTSIQDNTSNVTASSIEMTQTKLDNITYNVANNKTEINFILNKETYYYVEHNQDQQHLKLVLGHTRFDNSFPLNLTNTAIRKIDIVKSGADTVIDLELAPETQVLGLQLLQQPQTQLQLILFNNNLAPGKIEKKALPLTSAQRSSQDYQNALELLQQNHTQKAIDKLFDVINTKPTTPNAHELLATLLIQTNQFHEANRVLTDAIAAFPSYAHFTQLKAYVLSQQGQISSALQLMLHNPPTITEDQEYYAFIASLYQQQGQYLLAAQIYYRLLEIRPSQAMWWLGLGVTLESAGKNQAAQEAYHKASDLGTLAPAEQTFVNTKIGSN